MSDPLRDRFGALVPDLVAWATERLAAADHAELKVDDVVDRTLRRLAGRPRSPQGAEAVRELDVVIDNAVVHAALVAGDFDGAFARLRPHLRRWAAVLSKRLPDPRPDPDDFVQDAFVRLRRAPMFREVQLPLGYAHRVVKNLVCDHARARAREIVGSIDERALPTVALQTSGARVEAIVDKAGLDPAEACMVMRVVYQGLAVPAAQRECGGPPGDPYYVLDKIFDKIAAALGLDRPSKERG